MNETYMIDKFTLIGLLSDSLELEMLREFGVDSWHGYGENWDEFILGTLEENHIDPPKDFEENGMPFEELAITLIDHGVFGVPLYNDPKPQ